MNKITKGIGYTAVGLACTFATTPAKASPEACFWVGTGIHALLHLFCPRYVIAPAPVAYTYYQPATPAPAVPQQPKTSNFPDLQPGDTATLQTDGSWLIVRQPVVSTNALTTATQKVRTN